MSGVVNPFEELSKRLDSLESLIRDGVAITRRIVTRLENAHEWEPIGVAMLRRKKGRKTLLEAVARGEVAKKMVPASCPGGQEYLLKTADLDRLYPARSK